MGKIIEKLEGLLEWGGTLKDVICLVLGGPLRKFCVSDFRQKQEYHMYAVHDGAYSPCLPLSREGGTVCAPLAA